jgi:hypothetical protein
MVVMVRGKMTAPQAMTEYGVLDLAKQLLRIVTKPGMAYS